MGYSKFRCLLAVTAVAHLVCDMTAGRRRPTRRSSRRRRRKAARSRLTSRCAPIRRNIFGRCSRPNIRFVKVKQYKADSDKMLQRLATEYRAKKYLVDVLNFGGGFHTQVLIEHGIAGAYLSPETKYFAPAFKEKSGLWTTLYYNPLTIVYNTKAAGAQRTAQRLVRSFASALQGPLGHRAGAGHLVRRHVEALRRGKGQTIHAGLGQA